MTTLEGNAAALARHRRFVRKAVKKPLCLSLSLNAASPYLPVFRLTVSILEHVLRYFRASLKAEVGVLLGIVLKILESAHASAAYKTLLVTLLGHIGSDAQCLVDLFVNYDCDLQTVDLCARAVHDIATLVHKDTPTPLRQEALKALQTIVHAMAAYAHDKYVSPALASSTHDDGDEAETEEGVLDLGATTPKVSPVAILDKFEQAKRTKKLMEHGREQFKEKPRQGIKYFQEHGMCGPSDADVARFLRTTPGLDKTKIGEFLGEPKNVPVLYAFVDNHFDFRGMEVDIALRDFLQHFRLPGEAQKIDRMMEKFAEKYYRDNTSSPEARTSLAH